MKKSKQRESRKPYTKKQMKKLQCYRCPRKAKYQWNVCSDGGLFHPLCKECDIELNAYVLRWMGHPHAEELIAEYRRVA